MLEPSAGRPARGLEGRRAAAGRSLPPAPPERGTRPRAATPTLRAAVPLRPRRPGPRLRPCPWSRCSCHGCCSRRGGCSGTCWLKVENPQLWGGLRRAAEATASFQMTGAVLRSVQERPEPSVAPGGCTGRCPPTGQAQQGRRNRAGGLFRRLRHACGLLSAGWSWRAVGCCPVCRSTCGGERWEQ